MAAFVRQTLTAAIAAATIAGGAVMATQTSAATTGAFDSATWIAAASGGDGSDPRFDLIGPAIAAVPAGTSRDEVRATLGTPDRDYGTDWLYYAGTTLFGGEYVLLIVSFEGDRVAKVEKRDSETYRAPSSAPSSATTTPAG